MIWRWWLLALVCPAVWANSPAWNELLRRETGTVKLPAGTVTVHQPVKLAGSAHDLVLDATGVTLEIAPDFAGTAVLVVSGGKNVVIQGLTVIGKRGGAVRAVGGISAEGVSGLEIRDVTLRSLSGVAVVVRGGEKIRIANAKVGESAGGVLLERGVRDFEVSGCAFDAVGSPGVLVRAGEGGKRNGEGRIVDNRFTLMTRAAIQVGQTTKLAVERNKGKQIGYPLDALVGRAIPAAIQTAGDVAEAQYRDNTFEEVNGKCMGLDGLRDAEVRGNECVNHEDAEAYPRGNYGFVMSRETQNVLVWGNRLEGFLYGAVLVQGSGHQISHNHFAGLNMAHCNQTPGCVQTANEPDLLRSGIYLQGGAETRGNVVEANQISGFGMGARCVVAGPGVAVAANRIGRNECTDDAPVSARLMDR